MAVVTSGTVTNLDFRAWDLSVWGYWLYLTEVTSTHVSGDYRFAGNPGYITEFFGSGFARNGSNGGVVSGTVTGFRESLDGALVGQVEGLNVSVAQLNLWVGYSQTEAALQTLLAGADTILASPFADFVRGYAGNDQIILGAGNDTAYGGAGNDLIDGGSGSDTVWLTGRASDFQIVVWDNQAGAAPRNGTAQAAEGIDKFIDVETLRFTTSLETQAVGPTNFTPLAYIASHADLMSAYGANPMAGFDHYLFRGAPFEGRQITFSGLEYIASYGDLMNAFGANGEAGAAHFINAGRFEGRKASFDGLEYIASYADLMNVFGVNQDSGAAHFIARGRFEGRKASFDGLEYIASYGDLMNAFGTNSDAGVTHFVTKGRFEARKASFDGLEYIASYGDLIRQYGTDSDAGVEHYIRHGRFEHRSESFDATRYLANYADLRAAFGSDAEAATRHFILHGHTEGRTDDPLI